MAREDKATAADLAAQERGSGAPRVARTSRTVLYRTHPDTGLDVVFVPGEALPDWVELTEHEDASVPPPLPAGDDDTEPQKTAAQKRAARRRAPKAGG